MATKRIIANKTHCNLNSNDDHKIYPMKLKYKEREDGFSYDIYF